MTDPNLEDLQTDHEQFVGEVIDDPWADESQTDWNSAAPMVDVDSNGDQEDAA